MCDESCVACSKTCALNGGEHKVLNGIQVHEHEYSYGSYNRSGSKNIVTVVHRWVGVPSLDSEVHRLAPG